MEDIKPFTATPIEDIEKIHARVVAKYNSHTTRSYEYRVKQLQSLYWGIKDAEPLVLEACRLDLGKSGYEAYVSELGMLVSDLLFMIKNLKRFMKEENPPDIDFVYKLVNPRIRKEPLGTALVIGAYNFPILLSLSPFVGAIAAGCTAVLKPSENAPNAARVLQHIIKSSLDPEGYACVQGGIPESTELLNKKWDKIFYTGGVGVAKIIAKKAAENLTPVCLELGGRNPAIVTQSADLRLAARRLLWAKIMNAGQICVSQNYIMIDKKVFPEFVVQLKQACKEFLPNGAEHSNSYAHIVNERQWQRLMDLLASTHGTILFGGKADKAKLFLEPTAIELKSSDDPILKEESFGPLLPLLPIEDLDEAIRVANEVHATPLGLYAFASDKEAEKILSQTRSGGATINDAFFHASISTLAFGGVGDSGTGSYRGQASFDCFTHRRSVAKTPSWLERFLAPRYPPFSDTKLDDARKTAPKPNFDRQGNPTGGLLWLWGLLGLGGKTKSSATLRWVLLVTVTVALRSYRQGAL